MPTHRRIRVGTLNAPLKANLQLHGRAQAAAVLGLARWQRLDFLALQEVHSDLLARLENLAPSRGYQVVAAEPNTRLPGGVTIGNVILLKTAHKITDRGDIDVRVTRPRARTLHLPSVDVLLNGQTPFRFLGQHCIRKSPTEGDPAGNLAGVTAAQDFLDQAADDGVAAASAGDWNRDLVATIRPWARSRRHPLRGAVGEHVEGVAWTGARLVLKSDRLVTRTRWRRPIHGRLTDHPGLYRAALMLDRQEK